VLGFLAVFNLLRTVLLFFPIKDDDYKERKTKKMSQVEGEQGDGD
jgi:hypothetical protein